MGHNMRLVMQNPMGDVVVCMMSVMEAWSGYKLDIQYQTMQAENEE